MISGASPEPKIQSTFTLSVFSTANSVTSTASTTSALVRASSRRLRRPPAPFRPCGVWIGEATA